MYRNRNAKKEVLALEEKEKNLNSRDLREAEDLERLEKMDTRGAGPSFPMPFLGGDKRPPIRRQGTV